MSRPPPWKTKSWNATDASVESEHAEEHVVLAEVKGSIYESVKTLLSGTETMLWAWKNKTGSRQMIKIQACQAYKAARTVFYVQCIKMTYENTDVLRS